MGQDGGTQGMREPQQSLSLIREFPSVPKATAEADSRTVSLTRGSEVPSGPAVGLLALTADSSLPHPPKWGLSAVSCVLCPHKQGLNSAGCFVTSTFSLYSDSGDPQLFPEHGCSPSGGIRNCGSCGGAPWHLLLSLWCVFNTSVSWSWLVFCLNPVHP